MFTGLIEEMGIVQQVDIIGSSGSLSIKADKVFEDLKIGDSIAVNGVCLTVVEILNSVFKVEIMKETFDKTSLSDLRIGDKVNLERAVKINGRFGGHFVSGHIDGVGIIRSFDYWENAKIFEISADPALSRYIVPKGSIAVDGISLTVVDTEGILFTVSIIPHTLKNTNLAFKKIGDKVNLEVDLIAKYIEKLLEQKFKTREGVTYSLLAEKGFLD
ncbi:MAG TPA: riboflavin synthase [Peptococcaceae bacterium]|nr:riboflavin synthase [Peptococcaceae bacterium]